MYSHDTLLNTAHRSVYFLISHFCSVLFTCAPLASMWVVTLHSLFLYSDPTLPCHTPSYWLRLFSSQTFSHINIPTFSNLVTLHTYTLLKMEQSVPKRWHIKFWHRGITQKKGVSTVWAVQEVPHRHNSYQPQPQSIPLPCPMVLTGNLHTYQTYILIVIIAQSLGLNSFNPEEGGSMFLCINGV